jgi:glycosyltransferase involved in cell wall biosynthesis
MTNAFTQYQCFNMSFLSESPADQLLAAIPGGHVLAELCPGRSLRIGILGTRGIPNAYGGFEQFAQYLSAGLVQRGHSVWVYNSSDHPYRETQWDGVHIIHCRDWESRIGTAGQFVYDYNCLRDARTRDFDVLLQLGYTSNSVWHALWPGKALNVVNMDGLEWKRDKYSPLVRKFLVRAERWAARHGDILVADSLRIRDYIEEKYRRPTSYIPYGAEIPGHYDSAKLHHWGLRPDGYYLLMARMEPENNVEMIIRGWMASGRKKPLVIVGHMGNTHGRYLQKVYRDERLRFVGAIYEPGFVNALRHYASLYLHGHSVGGTNPSLLEAMACGCTIAAHDNVFNKEVLGREAGYFSTREEVGELLARLPAHEQTNRWRQINLEKIRTRYTWDRVIECYLQLFMKNVPA